MYFVRKMFNDWEDSSRFAYRRTKVWAACRQLPKVSLMTEE